ncbi:G0/G1 switch protein 2 [Heteronotia binoei]|uniref:G0/G1 switch protein 2 n=1 Tax=Heteronotia binoei TaxID=13085 RepID=UPI00293169B7|nr:G0/G1 switch protein 2 [Heteronotia binoei]
METMQELIPFAKEMLSQKPNRKMIKMYMLGSMLAFVGVVIGLVETVCSPFSSEGKLEDEETEEEKKKESDSLVQEAIVIPKQDKVVLETSKQAVTLRNSVNRQRAS